MRILLEEALNGVRIGYHVVDVCRRGTQWCGMRRQPLTSLLFFVVAQKEIEQHNDQRSEADHAADDAGFDACCQATAGCCGGRRWRRRGGRVARPAAALAVRRTLRATGSCELDLAAQAGLVLTSLGFFRSIYVWQR